MVKVRRVAFGAALAATATLLGGCGSSSGPAPSPTPSPTPSPVPGPPTPGPPTPAPGPVACPDTLTRGHCTTCYEDEGQVSCKECASPYEHNANATFDDPDMFCVYDCKNFQPVDKPEYPTLATQHNGVEWPGMCIDEAVSHFFTIGDWGGTCEWGKGNICPPDKVSGMCGYSYGTGALPGEPCPMPNRGGGSGPFIAAIEGRAQQMVSQRMQERAKVLTDASMPPRFVINVGDNFYPGGIDSHCGNKDMSATAYQFQTMWKNVYSPLTDIQWMGVLGNHDYGGICYLKGWDQQILFTWHSDDKWIMPGQFWKRTIQYKNFKTDLYFVDGNIFDARASVGATHDICNPPSNPGAHCETENWPPTNGQAPNSCGPQGPANPQDCYAWFENLWQASYDFLTKNIPQSDAEWQIVVNHYPANFNVGSAPRSYMDWSKWLGPMGVDLYISGHTHEQKVYYGDMGPGMNMGDTPWVITGGGGGITAEALPTPSGDDDSYGFMDIEISLHKIVVRAYSHGGVEGKTILRNETTTKPVPRKPHSELIALGLLNPEDIAVVV